MTRAAAPFHTALAQLAVLYMVVLVASNTIGN
jgi:hypothetical protein